VGDEEQAVEDAVAVLVGARHLDALEAGPLEGETTWSDCRPPLKSTLATRCFLLPSRRVRRKTPTGWGDGGGTGARSSVSAWAAAGVAWRRPTLSVAMLKKA
jgi:hypothetical protein